MTILYHHRTLLDGAEGIHIAEMIRAFETLGHTVATFAPGGSRGRPGALPRLIRRTFPQGLFECAAAAHNFVERGQARRLLDRVRPAFVYKRHALNDVSLLDAAHERGIPSVLEVNALYSSDALQPFEPLTFRRLARRFEARALTRADLVIAVSTPLRDLVSGIAPSARVLVVPNGADPQQFSPAIDGSAVRARYGFEPGRIVLGWSGVVRSWHRLDLLLEVLALRPSLALLVIGDGPDRSRVQQLASEVGVGDRVRFTGRVARTEMAAHLAATDVCAVADDRTGYASPMKLLEYMAMGKPVVAPDLANIRDIMADGQHGFLFAPGDARALASCLDRLSDAHVRIRLGEYARARIVSERNWVACARQVLDAVAGVSAVRTTGGG